MQNGTAGGSTVSGSSPLGPSPSQIPSTPTSSNDPNQHVLAQRKVSTGVIVGAGIGGLLLICIVILGGVRCLRHRLRGLSLMKTTSNPIAVASLNPFILSPAPSEGVVPHPPTVRPFDPIIGQPTPLRSQKTHLISSTTTPPIRSSNTWGSGNPMSLTSKSLATSSIPSTSSSSPFHNGSGNTPRDEDSGLRNANLDHILPVTLPPLYTPA